MWWYSMGHTIYYWNKTGYSATSEEWTVLDLNSTFSNYGITFYYDVIDAVLADMCCSNNVIPQSVFWELLNESCEIF